MLKKREGGRKREGRREKIGKGKSFYCSKRGKTVGKKKGFRE